MPPLQITEFAPAKVNLTLHVTGQRPDGYHLLDSLVVFCGIGDRVTVQPAPRLGLSISGPFAHLLPAHTDNLVLRAARLFANGKGAAIGLDKHLPLASGVGGGSADAAATMRALARLWDVPLPDAAAVLALGADLLVCLQECPARMQGIGDRLSATPTLPECSIVLVNPGVAVPTPAVFKALQNKNNQPMPDILPVWQDAADLCNWLMTQRNDMEPAARQIAPVIDQVLLAIAGQKDALIARMSGSGATCFGVFATRQAADAAARAIAKEQPQWWVAAGPVFVGPTVTGLSEVS